jgi:hypothetical protein
MNAEDRVMPGKRMMPGTCMIAEDSHDSCADHRPRA